MQRSERSSLHGLLARLFLKEADPDLLRELARPEIAEVVEQLEPGFEAFVARDFDEAALDELAAEYASLFLLPGGVSPYTAAWMEGEEGAVRAHLEEQITVIQQSLQIEAADFGLGKVPSDHIGMLLALAAVALEREPSGDLAERTLSLLAGWAPRFADEVAQRADSPLYRVAGRLLHETLLLGSA